MTKKVSTIKFGKEHGYKNPIKGGLYLANGKIAHTIQPSSTPRMKRVKGLSRKTLCKNLTHSYNPIDKVNLGKTHTHLAGTQPSPKAKYEYRRR